MYCSAVKKCSLIIDCTKKITVYSDYSADSCFDYSADCSDFYSADSCFGCFADCCDSPLVSPHFHNYYLQGNH